MDILDLIKKKRNLKDSSIKAYLIALKKLNNDKEIKDLNFLKKDKEIFEIIDKVALTTKRNYLTSILVVLGAYDKEEFNSVLEKYRKKLAEYNEEYNNYLDSHKKSDSQNKNWVSLKELKKVHNFYKNEIKEKNILEKETLNNKQFDLVQKYVVSGLYTLQPPIRLDYGRMKIIKDRKDDNEKDNFLLVLSRNNKEFIFNDFKNKKSIGTQKFKLNTPLNTLINIWLKYNKSENFLVNSKKELMSENTLSKYIVKVFDPSGKHITLNLLRHIFISENVDLEKIKKEKETAEKMMHSSDMQKDYVKI